MDFSRLRSELINDPLGWGYGAMIDAAAATKLNATSTGRTVTRTSVSKREIFNAIKDNEWPTTGVGQNKLLILFSQDTVDPSNDNARAIIASIFGASTTTRANLLALSTTPVSRADELDLGFVSDGDVHLARGGVW